MKKLLVALMLLAPAMVANTASAQDFGENNMNNLAVYSASKNIFDVVANLVNIVLTFLMSIAVLLFLYGGFKWFTSQGNSEQIEAAKKIMGSAVVGLAIIFASFAAAQYIFGQLKANILES